MTNSDISELSRDFGRALAEQVAPEELPFYDEVINTSEKPSKKHRDADLAFGVPEEGVALPIFLAMIGKLVLSHIWTIAQPMIESLARDAAEEARKALLERVKRWIAGKFSGPPPARLDDSAIAELTRSVEQLADRDGINVKIRDSIVAHIRTFQQGPNP